MLLGRLTAYVACGSTHFSSKQQMVCLLREPWRLEITPIEDLLKQTLKIQEAFKLGSLCFCTVPCLMWGLGQYSLPCPTASCMFRISACTLALGWGEGRGGSHRVDIVGVAGGVLGSQLGRKHIPLDVNLQLLWHLPRQSVLVDYQCRRPTLHFIMQHIRPHA